MLLIGKKESDPAMTSLMIRNMKTLLSASKFFNSEIPSPNQNRKALIFFKLHWLSKWKSWLWENSGILGKHFCKGHFLHHFWGEFLAFFNVWMQFSALCLNLCMDCCKIDSWRAWWFERKYQTWEIFDHRDHGEKSNDRWKAKNRNGKENRLTD